MDARSSSIHELLLGRLALGRGIVTPVQMRESLSLQARSAELGLTLTLPEVFLKKGFATREDLEALEREEAFHEGRMAEEAEVGSQARRAGLVTQADLDRALEAMRLDPQSPALESWLLGEGIATPETHDRIARVREKRRLDSSAELLRTLSGDEDGSPARGTPATAAPGPAAGSGEAAVDGTATIAPTESAAAAMAAEGALLEMHAKLGRIAGVRERRATLPGLSTQAEGGEITYTEDGNPLLGEYEVIREIGRGAMGVVYEAIQGSLNRRVALKVLPPELVMNEKRVKRFQLEAEAAGKLDHPRIVKVFGMGEQGGIHFFAMEVIEGKTFEDLIDEGGLPIRKAVKLVAQAAEGLQYAHDKGVVHRDIKPANLMVQDDGTVRIMDFGLARQETGEASLTASGAILGTPAYMSPEQAAGARDRVDRRSDVYSLGATLYEMLTLEPPLGIEAEESVHSILERVLKEEPVPPSRRNPGIPVNLSTVILKALAKDPRHRYPTAQEFGEDLERFLRGDPVTARPVGPLTRAWMKVRKHKALSAFLLLLASVGVLVPVLWVTVRAQARRESAAVKLREAEEALAAGDVTRATALAEFVVKTSTDRSEAVRAQRLLCAARLGDAETADLFAFLARLVSMDRGGPEGRWALARILERLQAEARAGPALALATTMVEDFAGTEEGFLALAARADLLLAEGSLNEAREAFETLVRVGRGGDAARERLRHLSPITPILDLATSVESLAVGDLDGDGTKELVLARQYELAVLRKNGGRLEEVLTKKVADPRTGTVGAVAVADCDGDGRDELLAAYGKDYSADPGALEVFEWEGGELRLSWRHPLHNSRIQHGDILVTDLDGDGVADIALGLRWYGRRVLFFRHRGQTYEPVGTWFFRRPELASDVEQLAAGPVAGRDAVQLAVAMGHWNAYGVCLLEADLKGGRILETSFRPLGRLVGVSMADLDGDGRCEVITGKRFTQNAILFGDGKPFGPLPAEDVFVLKHRPGLLAVEAAADLTGDSSDTELQHLAAGDVDGDGKNEILAVYSHRDRDRRRSEKVDLLRLVEGELQGELVREPLLDLWRPSGSRFFFCAIEDVDGDGRNEILLFGYGIKILGFD